MCAIRLRGNLRPAQLVNNIALSYSWFDRLSGTISGHIVCSLCCGREDDKCPMTDCVGSTFDGGDIIDDCLKRLHENLQLKWVITVLELPIPCKNREEGCDFTDASIKLTKEHYHQCRYRKVRCQVLNCYDEIRYAHENIQGVPKVFASVHEVI
jgi:hypothetical protein